MENMSDTLKGSGIAGEIDMPVQAHFQSMKVKLKWLTMDDDAVSATVQDGATLDCWASQQTHDSSTNKIIHEGWRFIFRTVPRGFNFGKLEVGSKGDVETEYEVISLRVLRDDQVRMEIDKENFVCRIWDGTTLVDYAQQIRQQIGL